MGEGDTISERVRFDDNVSFIDADVDYINKESRNTKSEITSHDDARKGESNSTITENIATINSNECYNYSSLTEVSDDAIVVPQRPMKVNLNK